MARVLVVGLAALDCLFAVSAMPVRAEKHRARDAAMTGGGGGANAAVAVARLGGAAALAAQVGGDAVGDLILAGLAREGVGLDAVSRAPGGRSSFSSILVDAAGERQIMNFRGEGLRGDIDALRAAARGADAVLADTRWPEGAAEALRIAAGRGAPGVLDAEAPVDPALLALASHAAFSRQGLAAFTGKAGLVEGLAAAAARIEGWLCVTDGAEGAVCWTDGRAVRAPGHRVRTVDTLGAGDVWHGAFALRLAEGAPAPRAMAFANAAAALKCTAFGGRDGCPDRAAVLRFMAARG